MPKVPPFVQKQMNERRAKQRESAGYILHTICPSTKKTIFLAADEMNAVTYFQQEAKVFHSISEVTIAGAELEMNNQAGWKASANGDYLHGDKVRIKLSPHHHLCKTFPAQHDKLTAYNEGIVESTRWSNVDGIWLILAEITITVKTPGRGKNDKYRRVTCTQAVDIPHLLTAATIVSIKANRTKPRGSNAGKTNTNRYKHKVTYK